MPFSSWTKLSLCSFSISGDRLGTPARVPSRLTLDSQVRLPLLWTDIDFGQVCVEHESNVYNEPCKASQAKWRQHISLARFAMRRSSASDSASEQSDEITDHRDGLRQHVRWQVQTAQNGRSTWEEVKETPVGLRGCVKVIFLSNCTNRFLWSTHAQTVHIRTSVAIQERGRWNIEPYAWYPGDVAK